MKEIFKTAIEAAILAGREIMNIYQRDDLGVTQKQDESPLTLADHAANKVINACLSTTGIPMISEENEQIPFEEREAWSQCWIIDPLDGTKEFIKRNGEFTVNIALVQEGLPVFGVIYAPALETLYIGNVTEQKAFKAVVPPELHQWEQVQGRLEVIGPKRLTGQVRVVGSRSHMNEETKKFLDDLTRDTNAVQIVQRGSSLKFCLVAEGEADTYPRFGPTMEWDTAAGQAICEAVGLKCLLKETGEPMTYNRENLLNAHFIVANEG